MQATERIGFFHQLLLEIDFIASVLEIGLTESVLELLKPKVQEKHSLTVYL